MMINQQSRTIIQNPSLEPIDLQTRRLQAPNQEDQFERTAFTRWNVWTVQEMCPPGTFYQVGTDVIDYRDFDLWTYEYSTLFYPLCSNMAASPLSQDDQAIQSQGFTGKLEEDFLTWFFKWYWRLDQTWDITGTKDRVVPPLPTFSWMRSITDGHYIYLDAQGKRFDDKTQLAPEVWNNFWLLYQSDMYPTDWLPETIPDTVEGDEDIVCEEGYFVSDTRKCLRCPPGCLRCLRPGVCLDCTTNFELVTGNTFSHCFPKCFEGYFRQTEFTTTKSLMDQFTTLHRDLNAAIPPLEMMETCKPCPQDCADCYFQRKSGRTICTRCSDPWFRVTQEGKCERTQVGDVHLFEIEYTTVSRCDDIVVRVSQDYAEYKWEIQVDKNQAAIKSKLEYVSEYFKDHSLLIIAGEITEYLFEGGEFTITLTASGNNLRDTTGSLKVNVLPEPYTNIYSSTTQLYVRGGQNIPLTFLKYYPKCWQYQYHPVDVTSTNFKCTLIDFKTNEYAPLNSCFVDAKFLKEGQDYVVRVDHIVENGSGIKDRTHYIGIQTETPETFCTFGFDTLDIDANDDKYVLNAQIVGDSSLVSKHKWDCSINGSTSCNLKFVYYAGVGNTIQFKPVLGTMEFEMTIQKQFPDKWIDINKCKVTLNVKENILPLELYQQSGYDIVGGFYDFKHWYTFRCEAKGVQTDWTAIELLGMDYKGEFTKKITKSDTDLLVIEPYVLTMEKDYLLVCLAQKGQKLGKVSKTISTKHFTEDFQFNVYSNNPDSSLVLPFQQLVTIEVAKPQARKGGKTLWCQMGFHTNIGALPFTQRAPLDFVISSATQIINTALPAIPDGNSAMTELYAECYDSNGQKRIKVLPVQLAQLQTTEYQDYSLETENPRFSDIIIYSMRYHEPTSQQLNTILDALNKSREIFGHDEIINVSYLFFDLFQKDPEQITNCNEKVIPLLDKILNQMWKVHVDEISIRRLGFVLHTASIYTKDPGYFAQLHALFSKIQKLFARKGIQSPQKLELITFKNYIVDVKKQPEILVLEGDQGVQADFKTSKMFGPLNAALVSTMNRQFTPEFSEFELKVFYNETYHPGYIISPIFGVDVLAYMPGEILKEGGWILPVYTDSLQEPLRVELPILGDQKQGQVICASLSQEDGHWHPSEVCKDAEQKSGFITCCYNHMASFALISYQYKPKVEKEIEREGGPKPGQAAIVFGLASTVFLLAAIVLEYQTSKNQKMRKDKSKVEMAEKDSNLEESAKKDMADPANQVSSRLDQSSKFYNSAVQMVPIPKEQESASKDPEAVEAKDIQVEISESEQSSSSVQEQPSSEVTVPTQPVVEPEVEKITFNALFMSVFYYHSRGISMLVRHEKQNHRGWNVISSVSQLLIASMSVSAIFAENYYQGEDKIDEAAYMILVLIEMRFVQALFLSMTQLQGYASVVWKVLMCISIPTFLGIQVYYQFKYLNQLALYSVWMFELILFDLILNPLLAALIFSRLSQQGRNIIPYVSAKPRDHMVICGV